MRVLEARKGQRDQTGTIISLSNLGELYRAMGRYKEAERGLDEALKISEQLWSKNHPQTLTVVDNLAALYRETGRCQEAEALCIRALEASKQKVGLIRFGGQVG